MATPCVEVTFLEGQVTNEYRHLLKSFVPQATAYQSWKGSVMQFRIITHRQNNASQHKVYIAKVRMNCQRYKLATTWPATGAANVHAIGDIRGTGSTHVVDTDNDFDITTMTFWMMHNLKDSAWPLDI